MNAKHANLTRAAWTTLAGITLALTLLAVTVIAAAASPTAAKNRPCASKYEANTIEPLWSLKYTRHYVGSKGKVRSHGHVADGRKRLGVGFTRCDGDGKLVVVFAQDTWPDGATSWGVYNVRKHVGASADRIRRYSTDCADKVKTFTDRAQVNGVKVKATHVLRRCWSSAGDVWLRPVRQRFRYNMPGYPLCAFFDGVDVVTTYGSIVMPTLHVPCDHDGTKAATRATNGQPNIPLGDKATKWRSPAHFRYVGPGDFTVTPHGTL